MGLLATAQAEMAEAVVSWSLLRLRKPATHSANLTVLYILDKIDK